MPKVLIRLVFLGLLMLVFPSLLGQAPARDTAKLLKILQKYESRGLPKFRDAHIIGELSERLEDYNQTSGILASRYVKYRELIETERRKLQLPWFVGFLPAANTGFEPRYRNASGFAGMWPIPYLMGKKYGLTQTALYDERHDPLKGTQAACAYLKDLQNIYQDWLKTITAYSIGPARLNQVIHSTRSLNFDTIYLALEPEERIPVIQFIAAAVSISEILEAEKSIPQESTIDKKSVKSIEQHIPFSLIIDRFGVSISELREVNPSLRTDMVPYMGTPFQFYLPASVVANYNASRDSLYTWLKGTPTLEIQFDTTVQVFDGDTAIVIETNQPVEAPAINVNEKVWVYYTIKRGDALFTLTDIFDCETADIKRWNSINTKNFLIAGKRLKFYVPADKKKYYQQNDNLTLTQKRERAKSDD